MRRYEKNYFLYHNKVDLENLETYFLKSKNLWLSLNPQLTKFTSKTEVEKIEKSFSLYENNLNTLKLSNPKISSILKTEEEIRKYGSEILKFAESIKRKEKTILINYIISAKKLFLLFGLFLIVFALTVLLLGYKLLIHSLNTLETEIKNILSGNSYETMVPPDFQHFLDTFKKTYFTLLETEKLSSLGKLLFSIAHEINNPLSNISTSIEILKGEDLDQKFKNELFHDLEHEVERTKNIIHSVLDFYKVTEKTFLNLKSCINNTVQLLKGYIPSRISLQITSRKI